MQLPRYEILGYNWTFWLGAVWTAYIIGLAIWIIYQRRSPVSTLAWIMLLSLMPVWGLGIYAYFGPQRVKRERLKRWRGRIENAGRQAVARLRQAQPEIPHWIGRHARLIEAACGLPIASAQSFTLLNGGGATLQALLDDIAQAQHFIHLEYYIFMPDHCGSRLLHALGERARAGVQVRLLVDAIGSARLLSRRHRPLLQAFEAAGGQVAVFHKRRLDRLRPLVNLRTHRKIVVIDAAVSFVGGINVDERENERLHPATAWRDTHLRLQGDVSLWLHYLFLQDWRYAGGQTPTHAQMPLPAFSEGVIPAQIVASGPDTDTEAIHRAMIDALNQARQRAWLCTPYFVPTEAALLALSNAALRGVEVKLMVPARSDSRVVSAAARSYYQELQEAGVLIFEYQGRMLHAKTLLVDTHYGMVGSANFDNRSFRLNFEVVAVLACPDFNQQLARQFEADLRHCQRVPAQRPISHAQRLFEAVARLASPLL